MEDMCRVNRSHFFLLPALGLHFVWWAYGRTNIVYVK